MRGLPLIEALGPVVIDRPVTIRVQILSMSGGEHRLEPDESEWEEMEVGVVLASAQCDFPGSDQGKGTTRGAMKVFRSGRCIAFEALAIPHEASRDGLVSMIAMFDHRARHTGQAERTFLVEEAPDD